MSERTKGWRNRRIEAGLSLRRLSALSGVNRGTISRIERGWPASPEDAARLVSALEKAEGKS